MHGIAGVAASLALVLSACGGGEVQKRRHKGGKQHQINPPIGMRLGADTVEQRLQGIKCNFHQLVDKRDRKNEASATNSEQAKSQRQIKYAYQRCKVRAIVAPSQKNQSS